MEAFPFAGIGGFVAVTFLVVTYGVFAGFVRVLGAAASGLRLTVVPGIVEGIRDWARPEEPEEDSSPAPVELPWEELPPGVAQVGDE
jgi:hypothetical protein